MKKRIHVNQHKIKSNKKYGLNDKISHLGCPSYPNCDIDSNGCIQESGNNDVEWYGHRD